MSFITEWVRKLQSLPKWIQFLLLVGCLALVWGISNLLNPGDLTDTGGDMTGGTTGLIISAFLKLLIVLILIYVAGMVLVRWKGFSYGKLTRKMSVVETLNLSPRRALHLVKVGSQIYLIGATDQSVGLVSKVDSSQIGTPAEIDQLSSNETFSQVLSSLSGDHAK